MQQKDPDFCRRFMKCLKTFDSQYNTRETSSKELLIWDSKKKEKKDDTSYKEYYW